MRAWGGQECLKKCHKIAFIIFLITQEKIELAKRIHDKKLKSSHPTLGAHSKSDYFASFCSRPFDNGELLSLLLEEIFGPG